MIDIHIIGWEWILSLSKLETFDNIETSLEYPGIMHPAGSSHVGVHEPSSSVNQSLHTEWEVSFQVYVFMCTLQGGWGEQTKGTYVSSLTPAQFRELIYSKPTIISGTFTIFTICGYTTAINTLQYLLPLPQHQQLICDNQTD